MNLQRIKQNMWRSLALAFVAMGLASCIADDLTEGACDSTPQEAGLYFSVRADGDMQPAVTRTAAVDALNENLVKTVDIFVFKEDGTLNPDGYVHADLSENDYVAVYKGTGWKERFNDNETYTVYALANYKGGDDLSQVKELDDLKEMCMTDTDIVYYKGMTGYTGEKTFLMDGSATVVKNDFPPGNQPYELNVPVYRAAVKVEVTVNFSDDWAAKFSASDLKAQVANYATVTTAIKDGYALTDDQRGYTSTPNNDPEPEKNFTSNFVSARGTNGAVNGSTIRFYAYVNRWDDLVTNETMLLIDLPGTLTENNQPQTFEHNFYKIPIISNTEEPMMERNTFYQVVATVDMLGTEVIDEPLLLEDVHFATAEWKSSTVPVGDDDSPSYLILSEYHKDIRNADGFDDLEFYSSSPLTSVTIATSHEIATAVQKGDITFDYPGEGTSVPGIYFVNKDNERQSVDADDPNDDDSRWDSDTQDDEVTPSFDRDEIEGKIYLTSTNPENVTKRYITLKVTNQDELTKYVVVEQYPLEYIQPIAGYYSYRDDLKAKGGTYEQHGSSYGITSNTVYTGSNRDRRYIFVPKVVTSNGIRGWYWSNSDQVETARASDYNYTSFPNNNMMYFVTLTETNEKYNIAHPLKETLSNGQEAAVSSEENDQLISPSFMLASQLGTVLASGIDDWIDARNHCSYYVETYRFNNTTYVLDDWRLPTTAEIRVIAGYQDETPDVMDEVLSGAYYYVSWQEAKESYWTPSGAASTGKEGSDVAVRCIRDVKPTDAFLQNTNQ